MVPLGDPTMRIEWYIDGQPLSASELKGLKGWDDGSRGFEKQNGEDGST